MHRKCENLKFLFFCCLYFLRLNPANLVFPASFCGGVLKCHQCNLAVLHCSPSTVSLLRWLPPQLKCLPGGINSSSSLVQNRAKQVTPSNNTRLFVPYILPWLRYFSWSLSSRWVVLLISLVKLHNSVFVQQFLSSSLFIFRIQFSGRKKKKIPKNILFAVNALMFLLC